MKRTIATSSAAVLAIVLVGCSPPQTPPTSQASAESPKSQDAGESVSIVQGVEPTEEQRQAMMAAKDELFNRLSSRLMEVMSEQGPAAAISVCQKEATQIASEVGENRGLRIGRTGVRLRNPRNVPPEWAKPVTDAGTDSPKFVGLSNGNTGAILPIKLQGQCLMCHGPKEQIAPIIQSQLTKLYPDDAATGFREGELRGWFWIELPSA